MKYINWKNIIKLTSVGVLLLAGFVGVYAETPVNATLIDRYFGTLGNSDGLDIQQFELAPKSSRTGTISLGTTGILASSRNIIFRVLGTSIIDDILVYDRTGINNLFVGYISAQLYSNGDPLLNINGSTQIEALADATAADYEQLCTDDFGRLLRCSSGLSGGPTSGTCGVSNGSTFSSVPSTGLCSTGTSSSVADGGGLADPRYSWTCSGSGGGLTASCNAQYAASVNGSCGTANGGTTTTPPSTNLCSAGTSSSVIDSGSLLNPRYSWTCSGSGGGLTASCNSDYAAAPVYAWVTGSWGLCSGGFQSRSVTCTDDGVTVSNNVCNINIPPTPVTSQTCSSPVVGTCYPYLGTYSSQPANNTATGCTAGTYQDTPEILGADWQWSCLGIDGGKTSLCSAVYGTGKIIE